jgi:hypothetical protein
MPDNRPVDGVSMLPLLHGEPWAPDRFIPFASDLRRKQSPTASIISQGHKLMLWLDPNKPDELYHLENDPGEKINLIETEKKLASELRMKLISWLKSARNSYLRGDYSGYQKQGRFIATPGLDL